MSDVPEKPIMNEDEFLYLLSQGRGVDLDYWWKYGNKTPEDFYKEVKERSVITLLDNQGRIIRNAWSTRTRAWNPEEQMQLLEVVRFYPRTREFIRVPYAEWTVRETRQEGETSRDCVVRGFREELDLEIDPTRLAAVKFGVQEGPYPSRVYPFVHSIVTYDSFDLIAPELHCSARRIVKEPHTRALLWPYKESAVDIEIPKLKRAAGRQQQASP